MLKATKFGGSSVSGPEQFAKVKAIIQADESRRIVVVSAAGKRFSGDHKLTDLLYLCHAHLTYGVSGYEILRSIRDRFTQIRDSLGLSYDVGAEFDAYCSTLRKETPVDELVSRGEYFTSRLMAEYLGFTFVDAADCVFFNYDGQIDFEKTYAAIKEAVDRYQQVVIPGFYGSVPTGKIKVMTRGGSDITGALAAAAVDADVYENWTDVSGILMADPKIVENPRSIPKITYGELRELAFMGASVLHEESIRPVKDKGIPLNIRNTNRPQDPGTMIVERVSEKATRERPITGIAGRKNFTILTLYKRSMAGMSTLRNALEILDRYHVAAEHITMGLDSFALVVSSAAVENSIYDLIADLRKACRPDDLQVKDGIALVAAVGRKMTSQPGTSGRLFQALGQEGLNIRTIAQGADELAIIVGVENSDFEKTIRVLYEGFTG
ncbi:MAG: aspartate kinase [Oscillospiraceae bacterium]|nr:aspartate kinase [Oscillospiraceae bacterium]